MDNVKDLNHAFPTLINTLVDVNKAKKLKGGDILEKDFQYNYDNWYYEYSETVIEIKI